MKEQMYHPSQPTYKEGSFLPRLKDGGILSRVGEEDKEGNCVVSERKRKRDKGAEPKYNNQALLHKIRVDGRVMPIYVATDEDFYHYVFDFLMQHYKSATTSESKYQEAFNLDWSKCENRIAALNQLAKLNETRACQNLPTIALFVDVPRFVQGERVCNIGNDARNRGKRGSYHHRLPWSFWSTGGVPEPACDVLVEGECGPYDYPFIAMRESDLVKMKDEAS